ncbi:MAG: hypothetical protein O2931_08900 [Planctomycetota bacterium]|nr:hypothetical protein [Planctomycetota bacterium]MDA1178900.1 hypothetical protein [Planctomycetota bacterium]
MTARCHWSAGPPRTIRIPHPLALLLPRLRTHGGRLLLLAVSEAIERAWPELKASLAICRDYRSFAERVDRITIAMPCRKVREFGLSRATFLRGQRELASTGWIRWRAVPGRATEFALTADWYFAIRDELRSS